MIRLRPRLLRSLPLPLLLLAALLCGAGCDRLAGTEVGNPEITVSARFALRDSDATVSIPQMNLKVMGMYWTQVADSSGSCWTQPDGHLVDFAADAQVPLPIVTVRNGDWSQAEMLLQSPAGDSTMPDSSDFATWSNPRYTKIVKVMGSDTLRFLFEMSKSMHLKLMFEKPTIAAWRKDRKVTVQVIFDVGKWTAGLGSDPSFKFRADGKHARYVLLSPAENTAAYEALKAMLPKAFMADAADML